MVVIVGGAKRIGAALVEAYSQTADTVFTYHQSHPDKKKSNRAGFEVTGMRLDLRDIDSIRHWSHSFSAHSIDTLIYVSSTFYPVQFGRTRKSDWSDHLDVNLKGAYFLCESLQSKMKRGGNIQFFGDVLLGKYGTELAPYAVAKAGLSQLREIFAKAWAPDLRVNEVRLGYAVPPPHTSVAKKKSWIKNIPMQRFSGVEPIIEASFYLNESDYITGIALDVAGGVS